MKKSLALLLLCCMVLFAAGAAASAETMGFGFVNNKDVALRRGIGGKAIVRLPRDCCVWIRNSGTDSRGVLWYEINAGLHMDHSNVDFTGWMKAEFIDAGDAVWHDIKSVCASWSGLAALKSDGTVETAGTLAAPAAEDWAAARAWTRSLRDIRFAGFGELGCVRYASGADGSFYQYGAAPGILGRFRLRMAGGRRCAYGITVDNRLLMGEDEFRTDWVYPHAPDAGELSRVVDIRDNGCRVLLLTDNGTVFVSEDESGDTEADWAGWTDIVSLEASAARFSPGSREYRAVYAAVREDGTVLAAPDELKAIIGGWTQMKKIVIGDRWVLGLKQDGTVLAAGFAGETPPDLSGWTDITDIGTGRDYCVGVRTDGTAAFAGDFVFMGEGHSRK